MGVFYLKSDDFHFNGDIDSGDKDAFNKTSTWLQTILDPTTGHPYSPLELNPTWWASQTKRLGKFATESTIKTIKTGRHDYNSIISILKQSNPTCNPKLNLFD